MCNRTLLIFFVVSAVAALLSAQEAPDMPAPTQPTKEHEWLARLAGKWESECEAIVPGQEPLKAKSTENTRMMGDLWLIAEGDAEMMGTPINTMLTLGYDPRQEKFVGSWIDSCNGYLWTYQGTLDEAGKALTLETRGPNPASPEELANFREVLEVQDADHKTFTSYIEVDGEWQKMVTVTSTRKN